MVSELSNVLIPSRDETLGYWWRQFIQELRRPDMLSSVEIAKSKDIFDIFDRLILKRIIEYGRYDIVKRILSSLQQIQCVDIITKYEERIKRCEPKQGKPIFVRYFL